MPRDLFADTVLPRHAPKRSKWTILGSIVAHAGLVCLLLVVPILSAVDDFVILAKNMVYVAPPTPTMPAIPAPPPKSVTTVAPDINPDAAPPSPPEKPVIGDAVPIARGDAPPGIDLGLGRGIPDALRGPATATLTPPPPPRPVTPVRPGGDIKPPARIAYVEPIYPRIAVAARVDGTVILEATLDESGIVRDVKVLRSIPLLDAAAIEAVRKWRYTPTRLNGVPVPVLLTVTVTFTLR